MTAKIRKEPDGFICVLLLMTGRLFSWRRFARVLGVFMCSVCLHCSFNCAQL